MQGLIREQIKVDEEIAPDGKRWTEHVDRMGKDM
jgi:hypothetical protein